MSKKDDQDKPISEMSKREFREFTARLERGDKSRIEADMKQFQVDATAEENRRADRDLRDFIKDKFGVSLEELTKEYDESADTEFRQRMREVADEVRRGRPDRARKKINKSRKAIKRGADAAKKKRGCLAGVILLVPVVLGALYGTYEGVTLIASMVW